MANNFDLDVQVQQSTGNVERELLSTPQWGCTWTWNSCIFC